MPLDVLMDYISLLKNLMVMAHVDGTVTGEEWDYLRSRSKRWLIDESQFQDALAYAQSPDAELELPTDAADRRELLRGFVELMGADGDYADEEMALFAVAAKKFGIPADELHLIIDRVLDGDDLLLGD